MTGYPTRIQDRAARDFPEVWRRVRTLENRTAGIDSGMPLAALPGVIDPAYTGSGNPKAFVNGSATLTGPYQYIGSGAPVAGDHVILLPIPLTAVTSSAGSYVIIGGGSGSGSGGGGGTTLTPTAVKTANYTAAAGDLVLCDISAGSFTVTFPTAPADKTQIGVKVVASPWQAGVSSGNETWPIQSVTAAAGGSDKFVWYDPAGHYNDNQAIFRLQGETCVFQYDAALHLWAGLSTDPSFGFETTSVGGGNWIAAIDGLLMAGSLGDAAPAWLLAGAGFTELVGDLSATAGDSAPVFFLYSAKQTLTNVPGVPWSQQSDMFHPVMPNGDGSFFAPQTSGVITYWTWANSWAAGTGTSEPFRWRRSAAPPMAVEFTGTLVPGTITDGTAILTLSGTQWSSWQADGWNTLPYVQYIPLLAVDGSVVTKSPYIQVDTASPPTFKCFGIPMGCTKLAAKGLVYLK